MACITNSSLTMHSNTALFPGNIYMTTASSISYLSWWPAKQICFFFSVRKDIGNGCL